jgi:hypothetical protein
MSKNIKNTPTEISLNDLENELNNCYCHEYYYSYMGIISGAIVSSTFKEKRWKPLVIGIFVGETLDYLVGRFVTCKALQEEYDQRKYKEKKYWWKKYL